MCVSPSKYSTVSTMCSSTRGPASVPSLVTWPTSTIAVPLALAMRVSCAAHSRTWATEPGAEVSCSEYSVWIESMTQKSGASASSAATIFSRWISASTRTRLPSRPSRRARSATCAPLSSPVTYSTFICPRQGCRRPAAAACSCRCRGRRRSAPRRRRRCRRRARGRARPGRSGVRATSAASISLSVATGWRLASGWKRCVAAAASARASSSVFQAPQCGHLPSHFGLVPPHSLQV